MKVKTIFLIAIIFITPLFATAEDTMDLRKSILIDQQKLFIMENMLLSEKEAEKFWPAYNDYQETNFEVKAKRSELLSFYTKNHKTLNDEQAEKLVDSMFVIIETRQALLQEFILLLKIEAFLPPKKIFRYLQLEQYFATSEQYELIKKVPLLQ